MNGLSTRQQIRDANRAASRGIPCHRRIDSVIGWACCIGLALIVLWQLAEKVVA